MKQIEEFGAYLKKKLEQMTASVYTEAEAANIPTIDDMKKLEVDIGQLYTDEGTNQV